MRQVGRGEGEIKVPAKEVHEDTVRDEEGGYKGFALQRGEHAVHMHCHPVEQAAHKA